MHNRSMAIHGSPGKTRRRPQRDPHKRFFRLADGTLVAFERREGIVDADDVSQGRDWLTLAAAYLDGIVLPTYVWSTPRMVYCDDKSCGNVATIIVDLFADRMCLEKLGWLRFLIADQLWERFRVGTCDPIYNQRDDAPLGDWCFDMDVRLFRHVWSMRRYRTEPWDRRWYDAFLSGVME